MKEGLSFRLSVRPIVCLSSPLAVSFLRISSFVFSKTYYGLRGPYLVICDSRIFLKKKISKMVKKGQETMFFGLFKKIKSLVLCGIVVKQKFLCSFNILQNLHIWEKSGSQMAKNGYQPMRVQYSLIVNISLID